MKRKKGFTLVELLVVIAVIALLMAILLPALGKAKEMAKRVACAQDCKQIGVAVLAYAGDTDLLPFYGGRDPSYSGAYYSDTSDDTEHHPYTAFRSTWIYPNGTLVPMKLGCLWARRYLEDPKVFYCPSNTNRTYRYASYIRGLTPNDTSIWGTLPQAYNQEMGINQWVRCGYSYYPIDETRVTFATMEDVGANIPVPIYTSRRLSTLHRKAPYLTDGIWKNRKDISHKSGVDPVTNVPLGGGINALFKDGHVRFVKNEKVTYKYGFEPGFRQGSVFENEFWNEWEASTSTTSGSFDSIDDSRYIFYWVYTLIKP